MGIEEQTEQREMTRSQAESDLVSFINLVHPKSMLGSVHRELISWWEREEAKSHQLVLLPRDHQKSRMIAYRVAWYITKFPHIRILYVSSTSNLATKQLKFIKDILTSDTYRKYWPEMVTKEEAKREKWTETEISIDHPKRKEENVRDPTIFAAGMTTNVVGMHCDIAVYDDVVVFDNASTEEGRSKVSQQYSGLASVESSDAKEWIVGTRYHPNDLYGILPTITMDVYDQEGTIVSQVPVYEIFERQVEDVGDGSGQFLWPRQQRYDGQWFGFNREILARKRAQYRDPIQFRAQYYNDPNDSSIAGITRDYFQYYDKSRLTHTSAGWYMNGRKLNIFASIDFAYSLSKKADYTSIAVVGIDCDRNYYVLDIDRFKTGLISEYYTHILNLHRKWDFRTIRAEVNAAQQVIVDDLKRNYIYRDGLSLTVKDYRPNRNEGSKQERVQAILQPRYSNRQVWHYQGGNSQILEEELLLANPAHDDVKDSVASCIELCDTSPPGRQTVQKALHDIFEFTHTKFGGLG